MKYIKLFENWTEEEYVTEFPQIEEEETSELSPEESQVSEEDSEMVDSDASEMEVVEEFLPGEESETGEGDVVVDEAEEE